MDRVQRLRAASRISFTFYWVLQLLAILLWAVNYSKPSAILKTTTSAILISGIVCGFAAGILAMLSLCFSLITDTSTELEDESSERRERRSQVSTTMPMGFLPSSRISRLSRVVLTLLPPLKTFRTCSTDETTTSSSTSKDECAICLKEFKNGELIQPFPSCGHEFHASCINSWLHGGNITCPICRFSIADLLKGRGIRIASLESSEVIVNGWI